ncbi:hypothetical protein LTR17_000505 [Elasticomyces elasticus]|nr:hypothetical protein LTR17_000505 [Elasticomyces elasticus]
MTRGNVDEQHCAAKSHKNPKLDATENSAFGKLSAELRNSIYEIVFADHTIANPDPAIINTCRQTRSESLLLYYSRSFEIKLTFKDISTFCIRLLRANAEALDKITQLNIIAMVNILEDDIDELTDRWRLFAGEIVVLWRFGPNRVRWGVRQTESFDEACEGLDLPRARAFFGVFYCLKLEDILDKTMARMVDKLASRNLNHGLQRTKWEIEGGELSTESEGVVRRDEGLEEGGRLPSSPANDADAKIRISE